MPWGPPGGLRRAARAAGRRLHGLTRAAGVVRRLMAVVPGRACQPIHTPDCTVSPAGRVLLEKLLSKQRHHFKAVPMRGVEVRVPRPGQPCFLQQRRRWVAVGTEACVVQPLPSHGQEGGQDTSGDGSRNCLSFWVWGLGCHLLPRPESP